MRRVIPCPRAAVIAHALQAVLHYLSDDEAADYRARSPREKCVHIFAALKTLQAWLSTSKKTLDKSYHTVAPQCLQELRLSSELLAASLLAAFTETHCAFAAGLRLLVRSVRVIGCVANSRGCA